MPMLEQDTEITLGTGRMVVLFFGLVLICAVFFAIGFSLGKKSTTIGSGNAPVAAKEVPAGLVRPSAAKNSQTPAEDLSFYKTVGQKDANTGLNSQNSPPQAGATPATQPPKADSTAVPSPPLSGGYYVQVAAVTRQEDADSLVQALKQKQYPAFANQSTADKFYRVQVGPYSDIKEAEAMRARLVSDGYNPILKK
jgi:cell division septation protein DedD